MTIKILSEANGPLHVDRRFGVSANKYINIDSGDDGGGHTEESDRTS